MELARISAIALISLLAAISPGPDFAIVVKNCMSGKFRSGVFTALGISSALLVHVSYCLFGIAFLIAEMPLLFSILKYLGAAYLFYLGLMLLKEKISQQVVLENSPAQVGNSGEDIHLNPAGSYLQKKPMRPFISGFLCNLLNPKATLFMLSLFTQFIDPSSSVLEKVGMGSVVASVVFVWYIFLSYILTHRFLQKHFARFQLVITKIMGIALCILAVYIAFVSN